jgi:uncharacterized protein
MTYFEWDDNKAAANLSAHGVGFETAALVSAIRSPLNGSIRGKESYGEERSILLGMVERGILLVVYTERRDNIRIISARRATKHEQDYYYLQNTP